MATRKKKPPTVKKARQRPPTLGKLRHDVDRLDRELVKTLNQRAKLSAETAALKHRAGQTVYSPAREAEILDRVGELNSGPLSDGSVTAVFRELISGCRALQSRLQVAYLGPACSYTHLAALERFGESVELTPVGSISAVFEEVNRGHADYGLVPVENSTDGRVADTLDMFTRLTVRICGEVQLRIHHCLLSKHRRSELVEIYSRPQALSQCRGWLAKHLPAVVTHPVESTSTAAQLAGKKRGAAAIASRQAGVFYGLDVLAEQIEDNPGNVTRFFVIGEASAEPTGDDKTSVVFETEDKPGALYDAIGIFKRNRLNMTWLESFPIAQRRGAYLFFVELDGHEVELRVRRAIESLRKKALRMDILGSYPRGRPIG